jgi:hypothetical protein
VLAPVITAGASSKAAGLAVSAWPARVLVTAPGTAVVGVGNPSDDPVRLVAQPQAYVLDARGRPQIRLPRVRWFGVRPATLVIPPHAVSHVSLTVRRPAGATPGDHAELLLLSTAPPAGRRVFARLRIGVVVVVRVPGRLVRTLAAGPLTVRRSPTATVLDVLVANRGNVDEWLGRGRVSVTLIDNGWRRGSPPIAPRRLLAHSSGLVEARFAGHLRGVLDAVVAIRQPRFGVAIVRRRYHLRL